eukprot:7176296-Pyramimonas_sp.AAC.1
MDGKGSEVDGKGSEVDGKGSEVDGTGPGARTHQHEEVACGAVRRVLRAVEERRALVVVQSAKLARDARARPLHRLGTRLEGRGLGGLGGLGDGARAMPVSYTHLRAHETGAYL